LEGVLLVISTPFGSCGHQSGDFVFPVSVGENLKLAGATVSDHRRETFPYLKVGQLSTEASPFIKVP
jgi:hypothetical protein